MKVFVFVGTGHADLVWCLDIRNKNISNYKKWATIIVRNICHNTDVGY